MKKPRPTPALQLHTMGERQRVSQVVYHQRWQASHQGAFAMEIVKLMMACGGTKPDKPQRGAAGADGAPGVMEQPTAQMTPAEIVERAVTIADLTFARLRADGLIVETPDLNTLIDQEGSIGFRTVGGGAGGSSK